MFSEDDTKHYRHLQAIEENAKEARKGFLEHLQETCDHEVAFHESWGGEDTLGNYNPGYATHVWDCALCGKRLKTHQGRVENVSGDPAHPSSREWRLPHGVSVQVFKAFPQTKDELQARIKDEEDFAKAAESRGFRRE